MPAYYLVGGVAWIFFMSNAIYHTFIPRLFHYADMVGCNRPNHVSIVGLFLLMCIRNLGTFIPVIESKMPEYV
jgi:hypothetical protein